MDCARRELLEETGYESDDVREWVTFYGTSNAYTEAHYYIARDCRQV